MPANAVADDQPVKETQIELPVRLLFVPAETTEKFDPAQLAVADQARYRAFRRPVRRAEFLVSRALRAREGWQDAVVAHASGHVVLASAPPGIALGVDLEVARHRDLLRIARFAFANAEYERLAALPEHEQCSAFYCLWVLKEALAKALRVPLLHALRDFEFIEDTGSCPSIGSGWTLWVARLQPETYIGLAVQSARAMPTLDFEAPASIDWNCLVDVRT